MCNCYLETNLDRLEQNIKNIKKQYQTPVKVMCVLKANAYGHGISEIAKFLDHSQEADMFAVANAYEAMELREAGIRKHILVLSGVSQESLEHLIPESVRLTVSDMKEAKRIQETADRLNRTAFVHIKIDTGMHRIGFIPDVDFVQNQLKTIASMDHVKMEGIMSHFA
ncbi:MAG TPA: alanine racemase, partial [Clostridiales bacterium]|nr:alanine racemase [Clostridiales bacterium]